MCTSETAKSDTAWVVDPQIAKMVRCKAHQLSRQRGFSWSDQPDIEQDLFYELLKRALRFDPARATKTTFAATIIKNKAASLIRAVRAQKRAHLSSALSLNSSVRNDEGDSVALANMVEESAGRRHTGQQLLTEAELAQLRIDVADANRTLPRQLREMAALLSHVPQFAAANVLGISRRQAAGQVSSLRAVYEDRGLENS